ncbi:MAG TPA: phosphatase PAP2 family protein [Candidatus Acidoferrum sp.]|nr:phosphatase PAP2 family protein [Candidatus Acidoferrum sp.]
MILRWKQFKSAGPASPLLRAIGMAGLLIVANPLRAADTMAEPTPVAVASPLNYLPAQQPDYAALLPPPPLPDSPEQAAELHEVRSVYHAAGSNDIAAAYSEKKFSVFNFTPAVGAFFQSNNLPVTAAFFERVQKDAAAVTDQAKDFYRRPRPYVVDASLANGKLEKSFGYPSGHSTESMVLALVLAELFPDRSDAIIAEARTIGWHRVQIARHYPADIYAGRVLARAIVRQMKANADFQKDFASARAEVASAQHHPN